MKRLVVDGTGTNVERQIRRMTQARENGFFVKAMYVRVPVRTAIARAAMRKTGVTPERIQSYQKKMASAMAVASEQCARHASRARERPVQRRSHPPTCRLPASALRSADEVEIVDVTFDDAPLPGTMHGTCVDSITVVG